ncbi:MAG: thiol reductase thioredoxin [Deltaproteobacteria bacterium RIFOXYD12_FULL_50_9]|nr:MAG: thiol reductase thioredoxin [Deltaproteobacteria bacterium RIFOXYD12_FULL_50_9]
MRQNIIYLFVIALLSFSLLPGPTTAAPDGIPVKDTVTLLDLGARSCIPCKMMAPILEELEKEYQGKAAVIFIDVWKDSEPGKRFKIQGIPTQIFFDKTGKETFRHFGFFDKKSIKEILDKLLAEK